MHHHEHDHKESERIHMGGGSVPGGSDEILECRPGHWASDHALAALRELANLRICGGRMLSWLENREMADGHFREHEPRAD